jgi:hypothetical protein
MQQQREERQEDEAEGESAQDESYCAIYINDFEESLRELEEAAAAAPRDAVLASLFVRDWTPTARNEIELHHVRRLMGRFVRFLGNTDLIIRKLELGWLHFDPSHARYFFFEDDAEKLFRDVLPNHRTIERIEFSSCTIPNRCLHWFASSVPASRTVPLRELSVTGCILEDGFMQCICAMLRRNVPVEELCVDSSVPPAECREVFDSVRSNRQLRSLSVHPREVLADTVDLAAAAPLRSLGIFGLFPPDGSASLALQLRTNVTLLDLYVVLDHVDGHTELVRSLEESLRTYNFTLTSVGATCMPDPQRPGFLTAGIGDRIPGYLRRNQRIHQGLAQLGGYRVSPAVCWPLVLEMVSGLPTLLYRFVRHGDLNALCDLLLVRHGPHGGTEVG